MANSRRRYLDSGGNQFMPMNVDGSSYSDSFFSTKKIVFMGAIVFTLVILILMLSDADAPASTAVMVIGVWFLISSLIVRFIIFEEKFYYKMYKTLKGNEITTPAMFWDITSIRDSSDGALLTYSDSKIGIILKIERDTITGKHPDFRENHYDALSDFYRELMRFKYSFVQMNIMEKAGNDPRLPKLDILTTKSSNENIRKLIEKEIGYIKNITYSTLYESDYILIYTRDLMKSDVIISETLECMYKLLEGAFVGFRVLNARDIVEMVKEIYGVKFFDYTDATLNMLKMRGATTSEPFTLVGIEYEGGEIRKLKPAEVNKMRQLAKASVSGEIDINTISITKTLEEDKNSKVSGVDFDDILNSIPETKDAQKKVQNTNKNKRNSKKAGKQVKGKPKSEQDNIEGFTTELFKLDD